MSLLASKLEELSYLEDSTVGSAENERWRLYELKLEMGLGTEMESGTNGRQHILSLYIDNITVRSDDPFAAKVPPFNDDGSLTLRQK